MPSVLYVDDKPDLLTTGRFFLEDDGKNSVETAESAVEALQKLQTGYFDVIISDFLAPEASGIDFLRKVRKEFGNIPFILFACENRREDLIEAITLGIHCYVQKGSDPVSRFGDLVRNIDILCQRSRGEYGKEKNSEFDPFFGLALALFCIIDRYGCFKRLNSAWVETLGWPIEELEGKKFIDFVHADDMEVAFKTIEDLRTGNDLVTNISRLRCKEDLFRWIEWRAVSYGDDLIYVIAHDITKRKQAEQASQTANKKLNLLAEITRHDIRNKLTVLSGYLSLLREYPPRSQALMYVDKLTDTTNAIAQHIEFTRLYQNLGIVSPAWQNVKAVFLQACTLIELHPLHVEFYPENLENVEIFADPLLERVFYNQIENTLRYGGPKKTYIHLNAHETADGLVIIIEDDGTGIPPDDKEKIFRRGFGKNTGLGLFLAREILSITGITICETGEYLQGARFELFVPKMAYRYSAH